MLPMPGIRSRSQAAIDSHTEGEAVELELARGGVGAQAAHMYARSRSARKCVWKAEL